jgi:hypothetical protein
MQRAAKEAVRKVRLAEPLRCHTILGGKIL